MGARRFFVADVHAVGDTLTIEGSDAHKILHVLRLHDGDAIDIADSAAQLFRATIERDGDRVRAHLRGLETSAPGERVAIDVAQAIPKGAKMDYVVEKLTELGVRTILPIESERTIARGAKTERWQRLARAGAAQSGRTSIPAVSEPLSFDALTGRFADYDLVLFPWEVA